MINFSVTDNNNNQHFIRFEYEDFGNHNSHGNNDRYRVYCESPALHAQIGCEYEIDEWGNSGYSMIDNHSYDECLLDQVLTLAIQHKN